MSESTEVRNAPLDAMLTALHRQQAAKVDVVAPATALRSRGGAIELRDVEPVVDDHGVTIVNGRYAPTPFADGTIATKLAIPVKYLRRLRQERPDLYDLNVNGLLHGRTAYDDAGTPVVEHPSDHRSFLLRLFRGEDGDHGVLRAMLSDSYGIIDNLDVLTAVLDGIRLADNEVVIRACDLSDSAMRCKVYSPAVAQLAPTLLAGYRDPFADPALDRERRTVSTDLELGRRLAQAEGLGYREGTEPVVFAGFRFSNSELGGGAVTLKPELMVQICQNGLTLPLLAVRKIHMAARMETGAVTWSRDTEHRHLAVITAQARDAVREWLSPRFLDQQVREIEEQAGTPVSRPDEAVRVVAKRLNFTEVERTGVLRHFIAGGQSTAGGIAHAITSFSQTVPDADRADELDDLALNAMALVSAGAR